MSGSGRSWRRAPCPEKPIDIIDTPVVVAGLISPQPDSPDPGDPFLWNLLALRPDLILVTGDQRLLQDAGMGQRVITPLALASRLQH